MNYRINSLFDELNFDMIVNSLAYFDCHKELLEIEQYKFLHRLYRYLHIKRYGSSTVEMAKRFADDDIKQILEENNVNELEKYRTDIDYFADLFKRYNFADKFNKLKLIEY